MTLTVDDLRQQLSADVFPTPGRTGSTITDQQLQPFLDAAVEKATDLCGPIVPVQVTETYDGGGLLVVLDQWPIVSVDAITATPAGGSPVAVPSASAGASWCLADLAAASLRYLYADGSQSRWPAGFANIAVTYTVGRNPVPQSVLLGILILAQHLYGSKIGQASTRPAGTMAGPQTAYAVPNRVLELWEPFLRPPAVA